MEGFCSTGQSPQWAVVPMAEEEEEEEEEEKEEEEEEVVFLATCFGSYTEPYSGKSSEWFVCTVVGALRVTRSLITNSS